MTLAQKALKNLRENKVVYVREAAGDWLRSRVEACIGPYLQIGHPIREGKLLRLPKGHRVEIGFEENGEFWVFAASVLQESLKPVPVFTIFRPQPEDVMKWDRRRSERAYALVPVAYNARGIGGFPVEGHGMALNLSVTGMAFNAPDPLPKGSAVHVVLHLPNASHGVGAQGEVVSAQRLYSAKEERWKIRVRWVKLSKTAQSRIQEFVRMRKEQETRFH